MLKSVGGDCDVDPSMVDRPKFSYKWVNFLCLRTSNHEGKFLAPNSIYNSFCIFEENFKDYDFGLLTTKSNYNM